MPKLTIGDAGPLRRFGPLTRTDFVRYAGAAADFNPFHHDDDYARAAGHPSVFAHGMFSAGLLASYVVAWVGPDRLRDFAVRFRAPVWPGDTLQAEARVVSLAADNAATLELRLDRNGVSVVTGHAVIIDLAEGSTVS